MTVRRKNARRNRYWSAAIHRLEDAQGLMSLAQAGQRRRWRGACYIAGIAVECMIKYAVCYQHGLIYVDDKFPELIAGKGHDLVYGIEKANLSHAVRHPEIALVWNQVKEWEVNWRYAPDDGAPNECRRFVEACATFCAWIRRFIIQ